MGFLSGLMSGGGFSGGSGIGNSQSQQSNSTETVDMSVVGGEGSINSSARINVSGNDNVITSTDHGAVQGALSLALAGVEDAHQTTQQVVESQGHILDGVLRMVGDQSTQHAADLASIKSGDSRLLIVTGAAVAGIALFMALKKG